VTAQKISAARRPYRKPTVVAYGSVRDLTQAASAAGMVSDGGMGKMTKTG
jgi:hypothetical protein